MVVHLRLFDTSQIIWEKLKLKFIYYKELHWRPAYEFATLFCKMMSILNIYNKLPITRYCVTVIALFWACFYSIPTYCNTNLLLSIISWFVLALLTVLGSDIRIYVARVSWFTLQAISLWRSITYLTSCFARHARILIHKISPIATYTFFNFIEICAIHTKGYN